MQKERLGSEETTMRVLSYLRMEIDPYQLEAYEKDLEEMIRMARETTGFLGMEVFQAHVEPNVYLVLSEWESHEAMRSFLMEERHVEIIRAYKRAYGVGFERRRYARLHGVRHELLE